MNGYAIFAFTVTIAAIASLWFSSDMAEMVGAGTAGIIFCSALWAVVAYTQGCDEHNTAYRDWQRRWDEREKQWYNEAKEAGWHWEKKQLWESADNDEKQN